MKKILLTIFILLILTGCGAGNIAPGNYVLINKNERPIYLIDIKTGERLVELSADKFYINISEGKKIASFTVEYTNFNTQSESTRYVELGFFNGKIKKADITVALEDLNRSENAIIIQGGTQWENAASAQVIGETLSNYGPTLFSENKDGYYYFYVGINYLRVKEEGCTLIKKPELGTGEQVFEGELSEYAYNFLPYNLQAMIVDKSDVMEEQLSIDKNGIIIRNRDLTREITIVSQDVIRIIFLSLYDESLALEVYIEANTYSFLGVRLLDSNGFMNDGEE